MDRRTALSPKKLRSSNIPATTTSSCPTSPTKKSRSTPSPKKKLLGASVHASPLLTSKSVSPARLDAIRRTPGTDPRTRSPTKISPYKVFTDDAVYATNLDSQIASNQELVLSPPTHRQISPSPRKREPAAMTRRVILGQMEESKRMQRVASRDPFSLPQHSFLTPPRPRLSNLSLAREEDRLTKSASPVLGRSPLASLGGFTIYVDDSEYFSICDTSFELGRDVNKENLCQQIC